MLALQPRPSEQLLASCVYEFPFALSVPGRYHLNLVWARDGFLGTRETVRLWPPCHFDLPLGAHAFLDLGAADDSATSAALTRARRQKGLPHCAAMGPGVASGGRWVSRKREDWLPGGPPRLVRCAQWGPPAGNGTFTPMAWPAAEGPAAGGASIQGAGAAASLGEAKEASRWRPEDGCGGYMESAVDYTKYDWRPLNCRARHFSQEAAGACVRKRRLLLRGDSHMRKLFEAVMKFACNASRDVKGWQSVCSSDVVGSSCGSSPQVCFEADPLGERTEGLSDYDLVVANFGQHPASGKKQMTLAQYKVAVDTYAQKVMEEVQGLPSGSPRFAWHETNAMPFRNDHMASDRRDWRTTQRLALYNKHSTKVFSDLGVPIVESFAPTLAMALQAPDIAHFPPAVLAPMVQRVLDLLCPA